MNLENIGISGGSGLFGAILGFLGIKSRIDRVDKDLQDHKKEVVYTKTFEATITPVKEDISEIKSDVKELLKNSIRRRNGDIT